MLINKKNYLIHLISFTKSISWLGLTLFFGLLQIWLIWLDSSLTGKPFPWNKFIQDGSLLFFATAIVSSVTIDYLLLKKVSHWGSFDVFMFVIFPSAIILLCVALFYISYLQPSEINNKLLYPIEQSILIVTLIYGAIVKFFAFKESLKGKRECYQQI
jgi:hypothetical protein